MSLLDLVAQRKGMVINMKKSKLIWIVCAVCAVAVIVLVVVIAFFDCWVGYSNLADVRKNIADSEGIVVSSPLYFDRYSSGAETVIEGDEAADISELLLRAMENVSYVGTVDGSLGYWDTRLTFVSGEDRYTVYLKDKAFYVTDKYGYLFKPDGGSEEAYKSLYSSIVLILDSVE